MSVQAHLAHLMHLAQNKTVQNVAIGTTAIATGSALSTVGVTGMGGALISTGCSLLANGVTMLGGGTVVVIGGNLLAGAAVVVGTVAPIAAVGYGAYKVVKRLASD